MFTLTLVFNKNKDKVLMCKHKKFNALNYIGGKVEDMEHTYNASYRELEEETGITRDDVELEFLRQESVTSKALNSTWSMYITAGILKNDVELKPEKNELLWVPITATETFINAYGMGNCLMFLKEARILLGI